MALLKVVLALASVLQQLDSVPLARASTYEVIKTQSCSGVVGVTTEVYSGPISGWSPLEDGVLPSGITYCQCGDSCGGYLANWNENGKSGQFYLPCAVGKKGDAKDCCEWNAKVINYSFNSYQINPCTF